MPLSGKIGEHYEIVSLLGAGAMGEVYRAVDRKVFGRTVAVKVLSERLSGSDEGRTRFRREVETAARLHHPNIVTIHDWGDHQGRDYFVMEFLEGRDLHGLLKGGVAWPLEQRLGIARQVADALDFAHAAGVIHRDIKPGNIMIVDRGGEPQVKLVDFGIVHVERSSLTQMQSHPGTFSYMSPEQLRNETLDPRSDLFSLGIVYYELFTTTHPFHAQSEAVISSRILRDEPEPPTKADPDLPADFERLLLRMLEKDPAQRPASAREVSESLRAIQRHVLSMSTGTDPADYARLDDLNRQLVENLTGWARQKEAAGALEDALAAYEKALGLAPDSERLRRKVPELKHRIEARRQFAAAEAEAREALADGKAEAARDAWRRAWALAPHDEGLQALDREIAKIESVSKEDLERNAFVEGRVRAAEAEIEAGRLDAARPHLVEVLMKYPDDTQASGILDQLMQAAAEGIPYGDYRAKLRAAREAIEADAFDRARAACAEARALWPEGPDVAPLEAKIAEGEEAARAKEAARREAEAQEARERERRRLELFERYIEGTRQLLADARRLRAEAKAPPAAVHEAYEKVDRGIDLILAEAADHAEALALRKEVRGEIEAFRAEVAAEEAERADAARKAEEARRAREAEEARKAEEAERARRAEEARKAREAEEADRAKRAEEAAKAREAEEADRARRAEVAREAKEAEAARKAEEARRAKEERRAKEAAKRAENEARKAPPPQADRTAPAQAGRGKLWIGAAAAVVLVGAIVAVFALRGGGEEPRPTPAPAPGPDARPGYAAIHVFPWGRLEGITDLERGVAVPGQAGRDTPLVVQLPPGRYRADLRHDAFAGSVRVEFEVRAGETTTVSGRFPEADARAMLGEIEAAVGEARR